MQDALGGFLARLPDLENGTKLVKAFTNNASIDEVASALEVLLVQPVCTLALGGALRSCGSLLRLLSYLVERRIAARPIPEDGGFATMLVTLLELAPQCGRVVQRYLECTTPPQELAWRSRTVPQQASTATPTAALRALQLLPGLRQHPSWTAGSFMRLLHHQSSEVRWAALQAVALLLNMSDASRTSLASHLLSTEEQVAALASWQARRNAVALEQAAMWLHVPSACEHCRDSEGSTSSSGPRDEDAGTCGDADAWTSSCSGAGAAPVDPFGLPVAQGFVEVCGIELACRDAKEAAEAAAYASCAGPGPPGAAVDAYGALQNTPAGCGHVFVATRTVRRNLEAAALVLCQGLPLLLEGPPGAGKTRLVEELAARTGNASSMVRVHLDDQMDAKSLLGAYVCTAVPGEFAWQPGPLTQAVAEGRWVLVEDINMAPGDVLAALVPLLESRVLHVSSRGLVVSAAPGFQIIATVTSAPTAGGGGAGSGHHGAYGMSNMVKELLGGLWRTVRVDAPTDSEQLAMLSTAYPALLPLLPAAVATLCLVQAAGGHGGSHEASSATIAGGCGVWHGMADSALDAAGVRRGELALYLGRHFSLRDVFKWCRRMMHLNGGLLRSRAYGQLFRSQQRKAADLTTTVAAPPPDLTPLDARLREVAFVEAADCFAALVAKPEARLKLLRAFSALWCAPAGAVEQWEALAKPQLTEVEGCGERQVLVGRVALPVAEGLEQRRDAEALARGGGRSGGSTFARTGHAMRVMERIAAALSCNEPVLLVGETGTGKTTMLSRMADLVGAQLVSFNLSQQTDSSDLLGGFKPVEPRDALAPLLPTFTALIRRTWTRGNNDEYLTRVSKLAERRKWAQLLAAFRAAFTKLHDAGLVTTAAAATAGAAGEPAAATQAGNGGDVAAEAAEAAADKGGKPAKKRRMGGGAQQPMSEALRHEWRVFSADLAAAERAAAVAEGGFAFAFVEGVLVKALRNGWWLLLDEINLAPAEVLERLAGLLETAGGDSSSTASAAGGTGTGAAAGGSVTLLERGDTVAVVRHPNFRLVAAMNPATDAGKHELPAALRNRFTEMWVPEPAAREDLAALVAAYLLEVGGHMAPVDAAVDFYLAAKAEADARLVDGAGQKPAYNLRTLSRALAYARSASSSYGLQRALYDGAAMAFLTQLAPAAAPRMEGLITKHLLPGVKSVKALLRAPPEPTPSGTHVLFEAFWLERGPRELPDGGREEDGSGRRFVMTASMRQHLTNLARAVLIRKHPILLQGPTSAGKTSLVAYLAAQTGHTFLRINNHEHTDLQEYLGSYVSDASGRLVFREGPLVQAVRHGWWVVLDELNLAPTEVLEALNRLLDDNRELLVPELGEVVRPHPHFMLFATQNPPGGAYAGRKVLSRAFRSRFLELHIDDIPDGELAEILEKRCAVAPSYAAKLVAVQRELQRRRNAHSVFAGKHGFITPRDLFRWAERGAVGYEALATDGALLLGERLRTGAERAEVVGVVEKVMNVKVHLEAVYNAEGDAPIRALQAALADPQSTDPTTPTTPTASTSDPEATRAMQAALHGVVWTRSMRRMYTLVERCLRHSEPVLLVGETGTGKTTVCQLLALMRGQRLHILNCNQHTETSDFLGGFRPTRGRERALGQLRAAAGRVVGSPLLGVLGLAEMAPGVPEELGPQAIAPLAAAVAAVVAAAGKAVGELDAKGRREAKKALKAAGKKMKAAGAAGGGESSGSADLDEALRVLQAEGAVAAAAAVEARAPFAWADGPLVTAMRRGDMILVDEINLAEDAVLERLNSVLEPGRTLTLAERGGEGAEVVVAAPGFRLLATMNPGGDFGKKELSPALANRFTTLWVPAMDDPGEMRAILEARLTDSVHRSAIAERLLTFWQEYLRQQGPGGRQPLSVRDLLAWVGFINVTAPSLGALPAYVHGAHLTLLDGIGLGVGLPAVSAAALRTSLCTFLSSQLPTDLTLHAALAEGRLSAASSLTSSGLLPASPPAGHWGMPPFFIPLAHPDAADPIRAGGFALRAPTTARNAFRLLRALQLRKALLLEGSPGVGKTSLVAALARCVGQTLVRINLSEQTDMMDLLGADLPAPGGAPGQFAWCDGPLLGALRAGHWVLLDELNLAGQSVLEGLNALLDHRSEVFIPELSATYRCHPGFRLFGAQNPIGEGGGRKGLPRSFLNRFTRVSVELLRRDDLLFIAGALHPRVPGPLLRRMVGLLDVMQAAAAGGGASGEAAGQEAVAVAAAAGVRDFAAAGGPWEFNLRDLLRWCDLVEGAVPPPPKGAVEVSGEVREGDLMDVDGGETMTTLSTVETDGSGGGNKSTEEDAALDVVAQHFARMLFSHRLRTPDDRTKLERLFTAVWGAPPLGWADRPPVLLSPRVAIVGRAVLPRAADPPAQASGAAAAVAAAASAASPSGPTSSELQLLPWSLPLLESLMQALSRSWMALLVGGPGAGKTALARTAAALCGVQLLEISLTSGTDTSDLLGSFEQLEPERRVQEASDRVIQLAQSITQRLLTTAAALATTSPKQNGTATKSASPHTGMLAAGQALQAAVAAHATAMAAVARQADAPSPITAAAQRVEGLQGILHTCRAGIAALTIPTSSDSSCNADADITAAAAELQAAADGAEAELRTLADLLADEAAAAVGGRFEWVDGALTRAIERGGWVLLEGSNLCNPTVLDRLNPLLEPGGVLYLNECGTTATGPRVIRPHPDFRLILALDPRHGEVSRAMRNRGIEIFLLPPTPPAATAAVSQGQSGSVKGSDGSEDGVLDADVEAAVRAQGVAGKRLLRALVRGHSAMVALAMRGHKRPPGLREAATAASLAAALRARGWGLEAAVRTGWMHVYLRGQGFSGVEAAEAARVLEAVVAAGVRVQCPSSIVGDGGEMEWDGKEVASAKEGTDQQGARDLVLVLGQRDDGVLQCEVARRQLDEQPLLPRALEAGMLAAPSGWPLGITVQRLAAASVSAGADRDVALLSYLLAACGAAAMTLTSQSSIPPRALIPRLQSALANAAQSDIRDAAVQALCSLSPEVVAPLLHGGAGSLDSEAEGAGRHLDVRANAIEVHIAQLVWAAAQCIAQRACRADAVVRDRLVDGTASAQARVAAVLGLTPDGETSTGIKAPLPPPMVMVASLAAALVSGVIAHPLSERLSNSTCEVFAAAGLPYELQQLQPLDVRYGHLLQPYLPGVTASDWAAVKAAAARLRCAQAALGARLLMEEVTSRADVAVRWGRASPLQWSYWRFLRPEERAATHPEHLAVDVLYPLLAALADTEHLLLLGTATGPTSTDTAWQQPQLQDALTAVQLWRRALWRVSHGLLYMPLSVQPAYEAAPSAAGGQVGSSEGAEVVVTVVRLDVPQLIWTWTKMDKALDGLLSQPDVAAALEATEEQDGASDRGGGGPAVRLEYLRAQMREALGLSLRSAKPLAWRLCGKPVLPSSLPLLGTLVEARSIAEATAAAGLDPRGAPIGLQAAGVDLDSVILAAAARLAAEGVSGSAANHANSDEAPAAAASGNVDVAVAAAVAGKAYMRTVEELLGEEAAAVRQQVAEAVSLAVCVDPGLRRMVGQGVAMLGAIPLLEALRPGGSRQGGGGVTASTSSPSAPGVVVVTEAEAPGGQQSVAAQSANIVASLREALLSRAQDVAAQVLSCPSEDEWMMRQGAREAAAAGAAATASAGAGTHPPVLLLPASWMASRTCRQLQSALLALQDCCSLRNQGGLLVAAVEAAVQCALSDVTAPVHKAQATSSEVLADLARGGVGSALSGCSRAAADEAPSQQLSWVLDELTAQRRNATQRQRQTTAADRKRGGRNGAVEVGNNPNGGSGGGVFDMQQFRQVVLPALVHDMWLRWHISSWHNCFSGDSLVAAATAVTSSGSTGSGGLLLQAQCPGGSAALDAPILSACVLRVLASSSSQVQSKIMRLRQLQAAVGTLLSGVPHSTSYYNSGKGTTSPQGGELASLRTSSAARGGSTLHEWRSLAALISQLLLAHSASLPIHEARAALQALCTRLMNPASVKQETEPAAVGAAAVALCSELGSVLQHTTHQVLLELLQPVVLPAAAAVVEGLAMATAAVAASGSEGGGDGSLSRASAAVSSAPRVLYEAVRRRVARDAEVALRGRAWVLIGLLRMQLVRPPPGIDPAGKYRLKRRHLEGVVVHELQPEILVRRALQQLPGGPSEAAHLAELVAERNSALVAAEAAAARCVPRPQPSAYNELQRQAAEFAGSLGAPRRVLHLMTALSEGAAAAAAEGAGGGGATQQQAGAARRVVALREAENWLAAARAWSGRFGQDYAWYPDLIQPLQLAVHEMARGLALLTTTTTTTTPSSTSTSSLHHAADVPHQQFGPIEAVATGMLRFPSSTAHPTSLHPSLLTDPQALQLVQQVARAAALQSTATATAAAIANGVTDAASRAAQVAELAGYEMQFRATRVALHALAREALARGHGTAVAEEDCAGSEGGAMLLDSLERLLDALVEQWAALKAYEEAAAAEEAQQFKTKTSSATFMNEDAETEATYRVAYPDHYAAFKDVAPMDAEEERQAEMEEAEQRRQREEAGGGRDGKEGEDAAATAAQARSSAARQLLDGELLTDVVRLHAAVYGVLAAQQKAVLLTTTTTTITAAGTDENDAITPAAFLSSTTMSHQHPSDVTHSLVSPAASAISTLSAVRVQEAFIRAYDLGSELLAAVGYRLDSRLDVVTSNGHLFRLCLEHNILNRSAAATAADAAAGGTVGDAPTRLGRRGGGGRGAASSAAQRRQRGQVIFGSEEGEDNGIDMQQPCVEEISLLQQPVAAMESKLRGLLEDYPDHPLLVQLRAIALRVLGLPLRSPLKTALTGLELLLSRAQLWEETAAQFVSLKAQLGPLAALATRWRRLELASWKGLLRRVAARHASGAHRSWFHLYRLIASTALHPMPDSDGAGSTDADAAAALAASGVPILVGMSSVPAVIEAAATTEGGVGGRGGPMALPPEQEVAYRRVASTLESFLQTSTMGEFRARLGFLQAFGCHVAVRLQQRGGSGGEGGGALAVAVAAALGNLVRYYGQFVGTVEAALVEGMAPLEKDLQDFVQLARWDDRGYYAMRASTEKAQRYLHRLSRRAEEVLRQPAATALFTAVKAMGISELATAAGVASRAYDAACEAEDEQGAAAGEGGEGGKAGVKAAAKVRKPKKLTAEQAAAEAEAADLAAGATQHVEGEEGDGGVSGVGLSAGSAGEVAARWVGLCTEVKEQLSGDDRVQRALQVAGSVLAEIHRSGGNGGGNAYLPRLPQLLTRLSRVVGDSLRTDVTTTSAGVSSEGALTGSDGEAAATADRSSVMIPDELAAAAIVRSHELRADVSKGARMRKRQALADLFQALEAQGLSRRQTGVPPHDRDVAAWFKHPEPVVAPLWQPAAAAAVEASSDAVAASWSRSDDYYYRSMARLQKLWRAAQQPHRDLSLAEVSAARRLSEHLLYVARRQRDALGEAAGTYAALAKLAAWMQAEGQDEAPAVVAETVGAADTATATALTAVQHSQTESLTVIQRQKQYLDGLVLLATETCQLLDACVDTCTASSGAEVQATQLPGAAAAARSAAAALAVCKRRLDGALLGCVVEVPGSQAAAAGGPTAAAATRDESSGSSSSSKLVWVTKEALQVAAENGRTLVKVEGELSSRCMAASAAAAGGAAEGSQAPGLEELRQHVAAAARDATAWLATTEVPNAVQLSSSQQHNQHAHDSPDSLPAAKLVEAVESLVRSVLLWAQPQQPAAPQSQAGAHHTASGAASASTEAGVGALVAVSTELEAALKLSRAQELASIAMGLLRREAETQTQTAAAAASGLLRAAAPMLRLAAEGLRLRGLRLLALHRSTAKLSYVCTAVLATLVEEGYCMPEERKEVEGGDGPGEFKEAEGTGLGDGTGAKDISDQLENQDQLLGAQQRGAQPEPQEEEQQQQGGGPEEENKGIEMDEDFEGTLQDVPMDERDRNRDSEDEDGDEDRIDQQMGEVGENEEVVDERLWNDEEDKDSKPDEQQKKKEEKYEKDAPIQVEDKTDLEYAAGQEEESGPNKEPPKKEQQKYKDPTADDAQPEAAEDGEEDEGPVNNDTDDKYEDHHHAAPQAAEEELELPEDMNLDGEEAGGEEQEQGQEEEKLGGEEAGAQEQGKEEEGGPGQEQEKDGKEGQQPDEAAAGGKEEGSDDQQPGDGEEAAKEEQQEEQEGAGGIGTEAEPPVPPPEQPEDQPDPMAVDRLQDDQQPQPTDPQQQQAGPRGVASGAPTQQPESAGAAHGAPEEQQPLRPSDGDAEGKQQPQPQQAAGAEDMMDASRAPDSAPDARQTDVGLASASQQQRGAPAPLTGGDRDPGSQVQEPQQQRGRRQQAEPNPLRNLGDALERWRANLAVHHEAPPPQQQDEDAAAAGDEDQGDGSGEPPSGSEFQFLGAEERQRAGDTQALAPATDEQAAQQAEELDESGLMQQRREEQQMDEGGDEGAMAMEEDTPAGGEDGGEEDGSGQQQKAAMVTGPMPRTWGGRQRQPKLAAEAAEGEREEEEDDTKKRPDVDELLGKADGAEDAEEDNPDLEPSRVVARLANTHLHDNDDGHTGGEGAPEQPPGLPRGLTPDQVEAIRQQLDERLRSAGAAVAEADMSYGSEVWSRCEALVSGLAGELTEQLRLILEPTLASKLAGDYRTGKRINMKKVIGYIASHFRRDKIWLRRNRPDKRRYQVLLACDDSRSMAENGCGGFALEALALICKAMSRLEVGQVGVLKFGGGEGVVPLHPLDAPFSDSVGPSLAARLTFRQDNTIADRPMLQLMTSLDHMLAAARHSCGAGGIGAGTQDLAQLVLVLADGRFHEKESLHAAVREAAAKRGVCLAFIVLDNPANSLLDMQSVSFAAGRPVFTKYLDNFPFPYYIVLRDIASLPATLADLLRQWFELSTA